MSYFEQTQRKTTWQKIGAPSPCQYEQQKLDNSRKFGCAPFGSTQKIGRMEKIKISNPQKIDKEIGQQFAVNDMSVKIKAQQQISSMFKSETKRFVRHNEETPGPGDYTLTQKSFAKTYSLSQFPKNNHLLTKSTVPSIPVDNLGFKENQNNQMQKVKPKQRVQPNPTSYDVRINSTVKGAIAWKPEKQIRKQYEITPGPGNYELNNSYSQKVTSSYMHSQTDRFGTTKKIAPTKTPGPGHYNCQITSKTSYNINSKTNQSYFNSKTSRFQNQPKTSDTAPGMYFNQTKKSKSMHSFNKFINSEQQVNKVRNKGSIFDVKNKNPGPGQYKNNFGMSYQLQRALLKKQATDVLPKQKRQVFEIKQSRKIPGPCQYNSKIFKKQVSKGKLYKKTEVVKLKDQEEPLPSPAQYDNFHNTIESKVKQMNSKLTLTQQKPFNVGAQRFKHYSTNINEFKGPSQITQNTMQDQQAGVGVLQASNNKKVKRLVMTTIKVRVPFGISSNKFQQKSSLVYQGPDFYNKPIGWIKPSFNIKGKLQ